MVRLIYDNNNICFGKHLEKQDKKNKILENRKKREEEVFDFVQKYNNRMKNSKVNYLL